MITCLGTVNFKCEFKTQSVLKINDPFFKGNYYFEKIDHDFRTPATELDMNEFLQDYTVSVKGATAKCGLKT